MPPVKKEVRFIINPLRQQQEEAALDEMMKEGGGGDDNHQQQNLLAGIPPPIVFTARLPLPLTVRCCSSLRNLADMLGEFPSAAAASAASNDDEEQGKTQQREDDEDEEKRQLEIQRQAISLGATGFLTGGNPTNTSATTGSSFLSEMPSVLPLDLPFAACSDCETMRLFCEWHAGCDYSRMEVSEVTGWGTQHEAAVPVPGSSSGAASAAALSSQALLFTSKNKKSKIDPRLRYVHALDDVTTSSSSSDDDDDDNQFTADGKRSIHGGFNTRIEHATLSALALQDRNPAVIFAPQQNGGLLPQWERQWVLDNFLSLESPACCAKAAKVAAMAEFMGCTPLIELMACVIASRLCERHNPSTEHMQWCLQGKLSGFA